MTSTSRPPQRNLFVLFDVHCSDAYSADECDYGIVELTPEYAHLILQRVELARSIQVQDPSFSALEFWDSRVAYFTWFEGIEDLVDAQTGNSISEALEDRQYLVLSEKPPIPDRNEENSEGLESKEASALRASECRRIVISADEVFWTARPKHYDCDLTTPELPVSLLEEAAGHELAGNST